MPADPRRFTRRAGAGGALASLGLFLAACGGGDEDEDTTVGSDDTDPAAGVSRKDRDADIEVLNFALTLEILENEFYAQVLDSGQVTDPSLRALFQDIKRNEGKHRDAVEATIKKLGGSPARPPRTRFDQVITGGQARILDTAAAIENLGAAAYLGQAAKISDKDVLAAALSIHTVEARQAAALNDLAELGFEGAKPPDDDPLLGSIPDGPFARPADMTEVLEIVRSLTSNASR